MRVFNSHWRNPELAELDAVIVGISRGVPRWPLPFKYRKLPKLAPDDHAWTQEDQEQFEASYTRQLEELGAETILAELERVGGGCPVVMLCWEKPHEEFCHRWTLAHWLLEHTGVSVPELEVGMLGKRSDAPQQALFD